MANVIIKDSERQQRESEILRDFGHSPENASREMREHAEYVAEKTKEVLKNQK